MKDAKKLLTATLCGLALIGAGCGPAVRDVATNLNASGQLNVNLPLPPVNAPDDRDEDESRQMEIALAAQNASGISGKALLLEHEDGKTKVMIDVKGETTRGKRPAHIHVGACPNPGAVKWPLSDVVEGKSVTTIDVTFDDVLKALPLAINLHDSATNMGKYIACGDLLNAKVMLKQAGVEAMMGFSAEHDDEEEEEDKEDDDDRMEGSGNGGNGY